jgi:hypothetical protein
VCFFDAGELLGGHVRAVFTLITFIFGVCVAFTVTSFTEVPLRLLELQDQVGQKLMGRPLADILLIDSLLPARPVYDE